MSVFDRALSRIAENRGREFNCIPFSGVLPRFSEYLPGILQKTYYQITANSKVGKTQFADALFFYHPYEFVKEHPDVKLKIFYNSLEMDLESKIIQGISRRLYFQYGLVVPYYQILSMRKNHLSDEIYEKIKGLKDYFDEMHDIVVMTDDQLGPSGIMKQLNAYANENGKTHYKPVKVKDIRTGEIREELLFDHYESYRDEYVLIITDHLAELDNSENKDIKGAIEEHSDNMRIVRNRFGYSPIDIQQQSAAQESLDHFKSNKLEPSADGLGESKLTQRKVNVILGLFSPAVHEIKNYRGYDITKLKDNYRNLSIIRNRNGQAGANVGLYFNGAVNYFEELPQSDYFKDKPDNYKPYEEGKVGPAKKQFNLNF